MLARKALLAWLACCAFNWAFRSSVTLTQYSTTPKILSSLSLIGVVNTRKACPVIFSLGSSGFVVSEYVMPLSKALPILHQEHGVFFFLNPFLPFFPMTCSMASIFFFTDFNQF